MDGLSAKVFRTYNASVTLQTELYKNDIDEEEGMESKVKFYNDCNRAVAILCNHQKTVSKNHEQQMEKLMEVLNTKKDKLKILEAHRVKLKSNKKIAESDKNLPKTLDQCDNQISKL